MKGITHAMAGVVAAVALKTSAPEAILLTAGALLPDIDKMNSTLGKRVKLIGFLFSHRGLTHSILFGCLLAALNPYLGIGVGTHILLDCCTPQGVQLFWPWRKHLHMPGISVKTGGTLERLLCFLLAAGIAYLVYGYATGQ